MRGPSGRPPPAGRQTGWGHLHPPPQTQTWLELECGEVERVVLDAAQQGRCATGGPTPACSCMSQQLYCTQRQPAHTQQRSTGHALVEASRVQVAALVVGVHAGDELAALHLQVNRMYGAQCEIAGLSNQALHPARKTTGLSGVRCMQCAGVCIEDSQQMACVGLQRAYAPCGPPGAASAACRCPTGRWWTGLCAHCAHAPIHSTRTAPLASAHCWHGLQGPKRRQNA